MEIRLINRFGDLIEISEESDFTLISIEGLGIPDVNINATKSPNQDGETYRNSNLEPRPITIEIELIARGKTDMQNKKRLLNKVINPAIGQLTFEYIDDSVERSIKGITESTVYGYESNFTDYKQRILIDLLCSDPFFRDKADVTEEIVTWIGGLTFPLELPTTFAMAGAKMMNVKNEGDVATPVTVEIYGPANFPKIQVRETGEYIRVNKKLTADDVVTITTQFGNKRVELNGVNAFNILELPGSTFFDLAVGDNVVELTTLDDSEDTRVRISYRNRYIGI